MSQQAMACAPTPVLIVGAGISGLLLAQQLRKLNIPFQIFERDHGFMTRGLGWGLTLHWSLPSLYECLPEDLLNALPKIYVNSAEVERGATSAFPFFDLSTGTLKNSTPTPSGSRRVRVTRQKLRMLLATGIEVQFGKTFRDLSENEKSVTVTFEDGTTSQGCLVVGCDGAHSRVRRKVFPTAHMNHRIPVHLVGFTMQVTADEARPILELDPFFLQGTDSTSGLFVYISLLEAPGESKERDRGYLYQVCISQLSVKSLSSRHKAKQHDTKFTLTDYGRIELVKNLVESWAEPFRSFIKLAPNTTKVTHLSLDDFAPHGGLHSSGRTVLIGDAFHAMTMYRGEGANHAIADVLELREGVLPGLNADRETLRASIVYFETQMIERTRPAVLAARQACLDAHDWDRLSRDPPSPLFTRRQMRLDFEC